MTLIFCKDCQCAVTNCDHAQIKKLLENLNRIEMAEYETFGNDEEARCDLLREKAECVRELRNLGWRPTRR